MINRFLLGSLSLATLLVTTSIVDARTLMGVSDWSIRKVSADIPYCTLSRDYDTDVNFKLAKNENGEGTIALDFNRTAFDLTRVYPIQLQINDVARSYNLRPASPSLIVIRVGDDGPLFSALQRNKNLNIQIDNENFDIDLGNYQNAMTDLNGCLGQDNQLLPMAPPAVTTQNIETLPVVPPIQIDTTQKDSEIDNLLAENRRLTEMLSNPPAIAQPAPRPAPPALTVDVDLLENFNRSQQELIQLRSQLADIKRQNNQTTSDTDLVRQQLSAAITENAQLKTQMDALKQAQSTSSSTAVELTEIRAENIQLKTQMAQLEKDLIQSRQSLNPNMSTVIREKDNQIAQLKNQNDALKQQMATLKTAEPEVIVKEIIREVPMASSDVNADDAEMAMRLAEAETQAKAFGAERDEYRRLLQNERRRLREAGDVAGQMNQVDDTEAKLIDDVRRLEAERADLIRELEFAKSSMTAVPPTSENDAEIAALNAKVAGMQNALEQAQTEKQTLQNRMEIIDSEAAMAQRKLAEIKVNQLADDRPEMIREELELKTMRAEIAALEAQNKMMRLDDTVQLPPADTSPEPRPLPPVTQDIQWNEAQAAVTPSQSRVVPSVDRQAFRDRLHNKTDMVATIPNEPQIQNTASVQPSAPIMATTTDANPQMVALSGDEIRQLVTQSRIPLKGTIDRIDRVSGPDFAAFRWDTGFVYGSGEQSRLNDISAFDKSVENYIAKTQSRCTGSFDQTLTPVSTQNGMSVMTADIACVDDNALGNAASILFFAQNGMFYALAHEANMDTFTVAMDMRDRVATALQN